MGITKRLGEPWGTWNTQAIGVFCQSRILLLCSNFWDSSTPRNFPLVLGHMTLPKHTQNFAKKTSEALPNWSQAKCSLN